MALAEIALPELQFRTDAGILALRDGFVVVFFMPGGHSSVAPLVRKAMEVYLALPGVPGRLFSYDPEGQPVSVDRAEAFALMDSCLGPGLPESRLYLLDSSDGAPGFSVGYEGLDPVRKDAGWPQAVSGLRFSVPTDFGGEEGLLSLLAFSSELADFLPFSYGYCAPAFIPHEGVGETAAYRAIRGLCRRFHCLDIPALLIDSLEVGDGPKGAYWGNFLSGPLVAALGGEKAIREILNGYNMRIRTQSDGSMSVWVAPLPGAGDSNRREPIDGYRALHRVLAPAIRERTVPYIGFDEELMTQWIHRFAAEGPA